MGVDVPDRLRLGSGAASEADLGALGADRRDHVGDDVAAAGRDGAFAVRDLRREVVDLGQERLGRPVTRVPVGRRAAAASRKSSENGWISSFGMAA